MAFTVEDGTGIAGANAYITVAFADTYFDERGIEGWYGDTTEKQFAIIQATDWIDKRFGRRFIGLRSTSTQGLQWPRTSAIDYNAIEYVDAVPLALQQACAEYALRALTALLVSDPEKATAETPVGSVTYLRQRVEGAVEQETHWSDTSRGQRGLNAATVTESNIPEYPAADLLIEHLLRNMAGGFVARA